MVDILDRRPNGYAITYHKVNGPQALANFFSVPDKPVFYGEFLAFWKSLSNEEREYYRNVDIYELKVQMTSRPKMRYNSDEELFIYFSDSRKPLGWAEYYSFWVDLTYEELLYFRGAKLN